MRQLRNFVICNSLIFFLGCSSNPQPPTSENPPGGTSVNESDYYKMIENYTVKDDRYSGLYSIYQFSATILNPAIMEAQLALKSQDFKWSRDALFSEKEKLSESLDKESKVFMSFYSPVAENDNLDTNKTIWKIWLVADGVRYEGVASKAIGILAQHQRLYPYHMKFFTPYILTFKVSMSKIQSSKTKLILTGPVGSSEVEFEPAPASSGL